MPYPDSEYPSILRGRDKRESQRLLAAAPEMLAVLKNIRNDYLSTGWSPASPDAVIVASIEEVIAKAEGRSE